MDAETSLEAPLPESWTPEERAEYLQKLLEDDSGEEALFAESMADMKPEMVEALMLLRDGGEPPSALASEAKERGNKHFKNALKTENKMWYRQAAKEYSDGIALCLAADDEANDERPIALEAQLKANRAACSLALKNYGAAKKDCREALSIEKKNTKALYRLGKACLGLKQWDAAIHAGQLGILAISSEKKKEEKKSDAGFREMIKIADAHKVSALRLLEAKRKGAIDFWTLLTSQENAKLGLWKSSERPMIEDQSVNWPLIIEYPELDLPHDKVQTASADDLFADWLLTLLSSPPDSRYSPENVSIYIPLPNSHRLPFHFTTAIAYADAIAGPLSNTGHNQKQQHDQDDDDDDRPPLFLYVHPAASIRDLLRHPRFVVSGPIHIQLRLNNSPAHAAWRPTVEIASLLDLPPLPPG